MLFLRLERSDRNGYKNEKMYYQGIGFDSIDVITNHNGDARRQHTQRMGCKRGK